MAKYCKKCVEEYNKTTHSITGYPPDYLMHGKVSEIVPQELIEMRNLAEDRAEAIINSWKDFERNKRRIDKNRRSDKISVGDYVYVENGNKLNRNKLSEVRVGPFQVLKQISESMFEIDRKKRKKEANIFHRNKLIPIEANHV